MQDVVSEAYRLIPGMRGEISCGEWVKDQTTTDYICLINVNDTIRVARMSYSLASRMMDRTLSPDEVATIIQILLVDAVQCLAVDIARTPPKKNPYDGIGNMNSYLWTGYMTPEEIDRIFKSSKFMEIMRLGNKLPIP